MLLVLAPLAPNTARATTVKHSDQWTLVFPAASALLEPRHRRDLVRLVESIEQHCLPSPQGGVLMVIEAVAGEKTDPGSAPGRRLALERIQAVHAVLDRLAPPGTLLIEDLTNARLWQARAAAASTPLRQPLGNEVLMEMACDPRGP